MVTAPMRSRANTLENGARMTRFEFHRRYESSPVTHAELIEGVVYVSSPLRAEYHGRPESDLGTWLGTYRAEHPGLRSAHNSTVLLDIDNELQPDLCLWREGGQARLDADGYIEGPPELVAEIAASSASIDLHAKKTAYRRNGVLEYIVWRVLDGALDWFVLQEGDYVPLVPPAAGVLESRAFPGLRLAVGRLLEGDLAGVLAELGQPQGPLQQG
ncbi:MAG: Uma2 family endonuclease [Tepidiformaceae bacterium]